MVVGRELASVTLATAWVCVFQRRTGARAQALLATQHQAKNFADRHALAFGRAGKKLHWVETVDSSVLATQVSEYVVTRIDESPGSLTI
jgi:hypothetical protein